jgi:formate hydrogenlyase subunit 3/multisubunit Na+/H+ antiporter MnhD subunit
MTCALVALAVLVGSAIAALLTGRNGRTAAAIAAAGAVIGAGFALVASIDTLAHASAAELVIDWAPPIDELRLGLDPLTAFFIVPIAVLGATCAVYGAFYLDDQRTTRWVAAPAGLLNLMIAAMLVVVLSRDGITFIVAWELMTLASYFLITFDHAQPDVRQAGWIYLVASHIGVACVLSMFLLLGGEHGFGFEDIIARAPGGTAGAVAAVLGLVGFGIKAGIVPLHVWLPEAHAAAPSHVSALMSGALIKLGIYGILRTTTLVGAAIPWGPLLLALGVIGALLGISLALYQRDIKRTLAYSSIENIGIVLIGLGIGLWASSEGHPGIAALGFCGGLFHIWNHTLLKGLMFLGAGSLLHGSGTRDLEQMGGLLGRMPRTGRLMLLGGIAISALPPLNAFASEWLMYLGLARAGTEAAPGSGLLFLVGVAVLAMVGVMSVLCFVRLVGLGLLGQPRTAAAANAHESGWGLVAPMAVLAAAAIAMPAVLPLLVGAIDGVAHQLGGGVAFAAAPVTQALAPLAVLGAVLWTGGIVVYLVLRRVVRRAATGPTWGCGYAAPTARMQYSGASFSEGLNRLFPRLLRARITVAPSTELFPSERQLSADRRDPFTRSAYEPLLDRVARRFSQLRWVQQGMLHLYILYIVVTVVGVLAIVTLRDYWVLP